MNDMRHRTHRRAYDPPSAAYPDPNGHTFRAWLNTIFGGLIVLLLSYIATNQANELANDRVTNYRLARIERELGIEPISQEDSPFGIMAAHASEVEK